MKTMHPRPYYCRKESLLAAVNSLVAKGCYSASDIELTSQLQDEATLLGCQYDVLRKLEAVTQLPMRKDAGKVLTSGGSAQQQRARCCLQTLFTLSR